MSDITIDNDEPGSSNTALLVGAPVEKVSPLGKEVALLSAVMLNTGQMLGSGIYGIPGVVLTSVGSIGLSILYWVVAPIFAFAGLSLYGELASMFPHRSGGEVVYLEQAYPRPKFLVSSSFGITAILMSFGASNAVVFAQYFLTAFEIPVTGSSQTWVALSVISISVGGIALSTKWSLRAVNFLSIMKILALAFLIFTGIAVLLGLTHIEDPYSNFEHLFEGSTSNPNALANALVKVNYAFVGWQNAFNVIGEIKGSNPVRTAQRAGLISLSLVSALFLLVNIAYIAVVPREEIKKSGQLIAAHFFRRVFGPTLGVRVLPLLVACSCFGNIMAVAVGQARVIREVARQGLLPYPSFFSSTRPFGTPLGPLMLIGFLTFVVILAVPTKDAFNFILDLSSYPYLVFQCALAIGVWKLRKRNTLAGLPHLQFQAPNSHITIYLILSIFLLVMPWVPPEPGQGDVSFWYATYCVAGVLILLCCGLYYWLWFILLPKLGGYEMVEEIEESANSVKNVRLVRCYKGLMGEQQSLLQTEHINTF